MQAASARDESETKADVAEMMRLLVYQWFVRDGATTCKSVDLQVDGEWILIAIAIIAIVIGPAVWSSLLLV